MAKLAYRLLSMLVSIGGGILASAIFAVVTASVERLAAVGTRSLTGTRPGEDSDVKKNRRRNNDGTGHGARRRGADLGPA